MDVLDVPSRHPCSPTSPSSGRAVGEPALRRLAVSRLPQYLDHFSGEEGRLRRQADPRPDRETITKTIFNGTRTRQVTTALIVLAGYDANIFRQRRPDLQPRQG